MAAKGGMTTKLFVGGLPSGCNQSELQNIFSRYGKVVECDIVKDYGFVHFEDVNEAKAAVEGLDGTQFNGATLKVQMSHSKVRQKPGMGDDGKCYRCGAVGHWTKECPLQSRERTRSNAPYRRPAVDRGGYGYGESSAASYGGYVSAPAIRAPAAHDWSAHYSVQPPVAVAGPYVDRYHPYAVRAAPVERRPEPVAPVAAAVATYATVGDYGRPTPDYYTQRYYSSLADTTYAYPQGNPSRY